MLQTILNITLRLCWTESSFDPTPWTSQRALNRAWREDLPVLSPNKLSEPHWASIKLWGGAILCALITSGMKKILNENLIKSGMLQLVSAVVVM